MNEYDRLESDYLSASESLHQLLSHFFSQLTPEDVEQFYQGYYDWQLQQSIETTRRQIEQIQRQIAENEQQMRHITPSTITLAVIARLQSQGVSDIDLLDHMVARGDAWLDHTIQLLDQCERLGIIYGDYTQWCEHALEGAYDWITSITDSDNFATTQANDAPLETGITEEMLLRKFMSEHEEETKHPIDEQSEQSLEAEARAFENANDANDANDADTPDKDNNDDNPDTDSGSSEDTLSEDIDEEIAPATHKEDVPETPGQPEPAEHREEAEHQAASRTHAPSHARTGHRRLKEQVAHHTRREAVIAGQHTRGMIPNHTANWPAYM